MMDAKQEVIRFRQWVMDHVPSLRALLYRRHIHREIQRQLSLLDPHAESFECTWHDTWPTREYRVQSKCIGSTRLPDFVFSFDGARRGLCWRVRCEYGAIDVDSLPLWGLLDFYGYMLALDPKPGDVVLDIGAFDGLTTLLFGLQVKSHGLVVAFEPESHNALRTRRAIDASGMTHIELIQSGVDAHSGTMGLSGTGAATALTHSEAPEAETVEVMSFEEALKLGASRLPGRPVKVKLDVEGAELRMIRSFINSLDDEVCERIAVASYHEVRGRETREFIEAQCEETPGVSCNTIYPLHLTTVLTRHQHSDPSAR